MLLYNDKFLSLFKFFFYFYLDKSLYIVCVRAYQRVPLGVRRELTGFHSLPLCEVWRLNLDSHHRPRCLCPPSHLASPHGKIFQNLSVLHWEMKCLLGVPYSFISKDLHPE